MVDLRDLDKALGNMGIELTEKESKNLRDNLPVKGEQEIITSQCFGRPKDYLQISVLYVKTRWARNYEI